jgi:hypothetical protein
VKPPPPETILDIVEVVTAKDGETFAHEWYERSTAAYAMVEAFDATAVLGWPNTRRLQMRYHDIEEEITDRVFEQVQTVIAETFVRVASEVLTREREREDRERR